MLLLSENLLVLMLKCSLWNREEDFHTLEQLIGEQEGRVDWERVVNLAMEQTVLGHATEAITCLPKNLRPEKSMYFSLVSQVSDIEKRNRQMSRFAYILMDNLKRKGCHALLLKGQGVGRNYRNPLHRQPGDIDLLLIDNDEYEHAKELLSKIAESEGDENKERQHSDFVVKGFVVEVHGHFQFLICRECTDHLSSWTRERLLAPPISVNLMNCSEIDEDEKVKLPPVQFDVVFIFAHMLNHFMTGGVGLRQICDCMMFLHNNYEVIDKDILKEDLEQLGLTKFWKVYAAMAVDFLGYPKEKMPFYDANLKRKGEMMLENVFKTGNFGAIQKKSQLSSDTNKWLKKIVTCWGQIPVYWRAGKLFPKESLYCFYHYSRRVLAAG